MSRDICIVGIMVEERACRAPEVQEVITRYGARILSRSGIPDPTKSRGIITLTMEAYDYEAENLVEDLGRVNGVTARAMCLVEAME
ncbi:MAG: hypothetical protein MJA84_05230 [Firmicutes bacterium]|nr:hypothetical protein [Bacillota bacterium]